MSDARTSGGIADFVHGWTIRAGVAAGIVAFALVHAPLSTAGWAFCGMSAAWLLITALALRGHDARPPLIVGRGIVDVGLLCATVAATGGAASDVRYALCLLPVGWGRRLAARDRDRMLVVPPLGYAVVCVADGVHSVGLVVGFAAVYVLGAVLCLLAARVEDERRERVRELREMRRWLLDEISQVERRERERLSQRLHDGPLQLFTAAQQDLGDATDGDEGALLVSHEALTRGLAALREVTVDLYPAPSGATNAASLAEIAEGYARRRAFEPRLAIDPAAAAAGGDLIVSIGAELIANAAKHARARYLDVRVQSIADTVVLEVVDDGVGFANGRLPEAADGGHIGLPSLVRRVDAAGGSCEIDSAPGRGTRVRVVLPA